MGWEPAGHGRDLRPSAQERDLRARHDGGWEPPGVGGIRLGWRRGHVRGTKVGAVGKQWTWRWDEQSSRESGRGLGAGVSRGAEAGEGMMTHCGRPH